MNLKKITKQKKRLWIRKWRPENWKILTACGTSLSLPLKLSLVVKDTKYKKTRDL